MSGFIVTGRANENAVFIHKQLASGEHVVIDVARDGWASVYTATEKGPGGPVIETLAKFHSEVLAQHFGLWALSPLARATAIRDKLARVIDLQPSARACRASLLSFEKVLPRASEATRPTTVTEGIISLMTTYPDKASALRDLRENQAALAARGADIVAAAIAIEKHFGPKG